MQDELNVKIWFLHSLASNTFVGCESCQLALSPLYSHEIRGRTQKYNMTCTRSAGREVGSRGKGLKERKGGQVYRVGTACASAGGGLGLLESRQYDSINSYSR